MDLKKAICSLFEVQAGPDGVQHIVTPITYARTSDRVVVRVRQRGNAYAIDENCGSSFHASMAGGDLESEVIARWADELSSTGSVTLQDGTLSANTTDQQLIAPLIFRMAEAAQQLHAISTSQAQRQAHDLEARFSSAPFS
jgi:hypothetical protein